MNQESFISDEVTQSKHMKHLQSDLCIFKGILFESDTFLPFLERAVPLSSVEYRMHVTPSGD